MNIVFFGTSSVGIPVLEILAKNHHLSAVITSPDAVVGRKRIISESPLGIKAKQLGLPLIKPTTLKRNEELLNGLKNFNADVFIVVSYGKNFAIRYYQFSPL